MYDEDDDDNAIFLLVLGVLAGVLAVIMWWFQASGDSLAVTAAAPVAAEVVPTAEPEPQPTAAPEPTAVPAATAAPEPTAEPAPEPTAVPAVIPAEAAAYTIDLGNTAGVDGGPTNAVLTGEVANEAARQAAEDAALGLFDTVDNQLTIVDDGTLSADLAPEITVIGSATAAVSQAVDTTYTGTPFAATNNLNIIAEPSSEDLVASLNELFQLEPIQFDTGSAAIRAESQPTLDEAIRLLTSVPTGNVEIQGHTDDQGGEASNQTLSQGRADSVLAYLVNGGVDASRLTAVGYGEANPTADNSTAEGRQLNRRIEFVLAS